MKIYLIKNKQGGQVLMATVILFLTLSLTVILGMAMPVANQIKVSSDLEVSRRSYATAEIGNEEIYYRSTRVKLFLQLFHLVSPEHWRAR